MDLVSSAPPAFVDFLCSAASPFFYPAEAPVDLMR
jgi:hypothetical protein